MDKRNITIYWKTKDTELIHRIRKELNITEGMTVNGENIIEADAGMFEKIRQLAELGYIQIRNKHS